MRRAKRSGRRRDAFLFRTNANTRSTRDARRAGTQADNPAIMDGSSVNAPGPFQAVAPERMGGSVIELVGSPARAGGIIACVDVYCEPVSSYAGHVQPLGVRVLYPT